MTGQGTRLSATESVETVHPVVSDTVSSPMVVWMVNGAGTVAHAVDGTATVVDGWALALGHPGRRVHVSTGSTEGVARCTNCVNVVSRSCGSYAGYQAHKRRGQTPCQPCKDANAQYQRDRRNDSEEQE